MIEWKEFNKNKPPKTGIEYIVTNGTEVDVSAYVNPFDSGAYWEAEQIWSVSSVSHVSHYAEINLPQKNEQHVKYEEDPNQVRLELDGKLRGGK